MLIFLILSICLLQAAWASIVYDHIDGVSMGSLATRSTFSTDSSSSSPQSVTFFNFRVPCKEGQVDYLAHIGPHVPYKIDLPASVEIHSSSRYSLVTVLGAPKDCSRDYHALLRDYATKDDVWSSAFQDHIVLAPGHCGSGWAKAIKNHYHTNQQTVVSVSSGSLASGPYLSLSSHSHTLYPVYRLYTDSQYAFTEGILPVNQAANASQQEYVQAPTGGQDGYAMSALGIPVPSRLYFEGKQTKEKPLAGLRVAIKDIFDIAGLRTGCGSRAYYSHYNAALYNSVPVQQFLEKGAILVGKTKASQFANGESPTVDWVDQLCPFNIRGDGYQSPSSSSSGSGAAQAAYKWLDAALGSDTGGSIRGPAGVNGVLGIRPSTGIISLAGVMPLSDVQDTAGYFARDAHTFAKVGRAFYGDIVTSKATDGVVSRISSLLVPSDFWEGYLVPTKGGSSVAADPSYDGTAASNFAQFIQKLSSQLNSATIKQDAFEGLWNASSQGKTKGNLDSYLNSTYPVLIGGYQNRVLAQPFIQSYSQANGGRNPFIDPVPLVRWAYGASKGEQGYQEALDEQKTFASFVPSEVLSSECSSLLLYPQTDGSPSYRNNYLSPPKPPLGFGAGRIANLAGMPEIVIPIGQAHYNSTITMSMSDTLPVSMSIVGGRNCDGQLLHLAATLEKAGITNAVKVGAMTF